MPFTPGPWIGMPINIKEAREWLSEAVNTLADPHDACDFGNNEAAALLQTINDALGHLKHVAENLSE